MGDKMLFVRCAQLFAALRWFIPSWMEFMPLNMHVYLSAVLLVPWRPIGVRVGLSVCFHGTHFHMPTIQFLSSKAGGLPVMVTPARIVWDELKQVA